jgi:hypothetical protein
MGNTETASLPTTVLTSTSSAGKSRIQAVDALHVVFSDRPDAYYCGHLPHALDHPFLCSGIRVHSRHRSPLELPVAFIGPMAGTHNSFFPHSVLRLGSRFDLRCVQFVARGFRVDYDPVTNFQLIDG